MVMVAATLGLPPRALPVIHMLEGGAPGMVRPNTNGTEDLGVMQVNTIWLPVLADRAAFSQAETKSLLIYNACFNIAAAGLILKSYLVESDGDLVSAIGDYHSHTPALKAAYAADAERQAERVFRDSK
jgi:hypothetical protein